MPRMKVGGRRRSAQSKSTGRGAGSGGGRQLYVCDYVHSAELELGTCISQ